MKEFIKSGIYGVLVGDCLGVPYEFKTLKEMENNKCDGMTGYGTWNQPRGTWSDDTSLTLATMKSISKNNGEINYHSLMREFARWYYTGEYTSNGEVFDCGMTTSDAIINYSMGNSPLECGMTGEHNNGNGSLMRILPLSFTNADYEEIMNVCGLTHGHIRSKIACVLYVEIARQIINHYGDLEYTFCDCVSIASEKVVNYFNDTDELAHFNRIFKSDYSSGVKSSGYVVDTLECAVASIKYNEDFKSALLYAVNLGGDTDTVCAVTGGLAGLYYGHEYIPKEWLDAIYNIGIVDGIVNEFVSKVVYTE